MQATTPRQRTSHKMKASDRVVDQIRRRDKFNLFAIKETRNDVVVGVFWCALCSSIKISQLQLRILLVL